MLTYYSFASSAVEKRRVQGYGFSTSLETNGAFA